MGLTAGGIGAHLTMLRALDVAQLGMALRDLEHDALVLPSLPGMGMLDTGDAIGMA